MVRDLDAGGLTPDIGLVSQVAAAVRIPVRVMLRESASMFIKDGAELGVLHKKALEIRAFKVDGFVAGFLNPSTTDIDIAALQSIIAIGPEMKITFHRAFDELRDPIAAIGLLKTIPQIDRILTIGGAGSWAERRARLHQWQLCAAPEITILAGAGVLLPVISDLQQDPHITEMHVGRAARLPQENHGRVSRLQVAQLKGLSA